MPSLSAACGEKRATAVSLDHPVCPVWMGDPVVMVSQDFPDPKELLVLCKSKGNEAHLASRVSLEFQETGAHRELRALDLRDLQERRVSREFQGDLEVLEHQEPKASLD